MSHMPISLQRRGNSAAGLLALCAVALAACSWPAPPPEGPAPTSLAKADPLVVGLQPAARGVRVLARYAEPDLAGDSIRAASRVARQIARAVQAGAKDLPPGAEVITLDMHGVDVDKFGKRSNSRLFETDLDVGALRDLDLKAKGPAAVLDTAIDLRIAKAGIDPINAWCMRYPHAAGNYCNMAGD
jgi:hypothetical protein